MAQCSTRGVVHPADALEWEEYLAFLRTLAGEPVEAGPGEDEAAETVDVTDLPL